MVQLCISLEPKLGLRIARREEECPDAPTRSLGARRLKCARSKKNIHVTGPRDHARALVDSLLLRKTGLAYLFLEGT